MSYTYITETDAETELSRRLQDTAFIQWTQAELALYLAEAIRVWNALTEVAQDSMTFSLVAGTNWYDLSTQSGTVVGMTITDYNLVSEIEYHLLEPQATTTWIGSAQYGIAQIFSTLQNVRDEVLGLTGCVLTVSTISGGTSTRITLPDTTLAVRRVRCIPVSTYSSVVLTEATEASKYHFNPGYLTNATIPQNYILPSGAPLYFDVDSTPPVSCSYEVVLVKSGAALTAGDTGVALGLPNDWAWVVKYGALARLWAKEGSSKDPLRQAYAQRRYDEGIKLLADRKIITAATINSVASYVDSVHNGDRFCSSWQGTGVPAGVYVMGNNLVGISSPATGSYSINLSLVANSTTGGTYLQISRDDYYTILDYAQHIAMLKTGGAAFVATTPFYDEFVKKAKLRNSKLIDSLAVDESDHNALYKTDRPSDIL